MIRVFKKFKDLLDVSWSGSEGKFWKTKADGSGLEAVAVEYSDLEGEAAFGSSTDKTVFEADGTMVAYGSVIKVVRFDTPELSFNLGSDYSAWDLKLYYREQEGGELKIKDCTWIDESLGQGSTEFSSLETSELGTYVCELKLLKAGKILTTLKFSLVIYEGLGV